MTSIVIASSVTRPFFGVSAREVGKPVKWVPVRDFADWLVNRALPTNDRVLRMEQYEKILETLCPGISFGVGGISVYRPEELPSLQVGYSVSATGESLIGDKSGDWFKSWIVIGHEEACGDPIFIDTSEEGFPVYTAMHGEGTWNPERIAVSLEAFGRALSAVAVIAEGRENPVALENNPLTPSEKETTFAFIRNTNPGVELDFWEILLS